MCVQQNKSKMAFSGLERIDQLQELKQSLDGLNFALSDLSMQRADLLSDIDELEEVKYESYNSTWPPGDEPRLPSGFTPVVPLYKDVVKGETPLLPDYQQDDVEQESFASLSAEEAKRIEKLRKLGLRFLKKTGKPDELETIDAGQAADSIESGSTVESAEDLNVTSSAEPLHASVNVRDVG